MAKASKIDKFLALDDAEKAAVADHAADAPGRALTAAERARWATAQAALKAKHSARGRSAAKAGGGEKVIALTVERGLLKRADAYAKANGLKRAELFAKGLEMAMVVESRASSARGH